MSIAEIKREPRNAEAIGVVKGALKVVEESEDATEVLMFVKIGPDYYRYSTSIKDMMTLIATLEVAKVDAINRMTST